MRGRWGSIRRRAARTSAIVGSSIPESLPSSGALARKGRSAEHHLGASPKRRAERRAAALRHRLDRDDPRAGGVEAGPGRRTPPRPSPPVRVTPARGDDRRRDRHRLCAVAPRGPVPGGRGGRAHVRHRQAHERRADVRPARAGGRRRRCRDARAGMPMGAAGTARSRARAGGGPARRPRRAARRHEHHLPRRRRDPVGPCPRDGRPLRDQQRVRARAGRGDPGAPRRGAPHGCARAP